MSKKLNAQAVAAAHQAAADATTEANDLYEALRARLRDDLALAVNLGLLIQAILDDVSGKLIPGDVDIRHRDALEPVANSYGYTLVDHETRRTRVVVKPI